MKLSSVASLLLATACGCAASRVLLGPYVPQNDGVRLSTAEMGSSDSMGTDVGVGVGGRWNWTECGMYMSAYTHIIHPGSDMCFMGWGSQVIQRPP